MFARAETFDGDVRDLIFVGNKMDLNVAPSNSFMDTMEINFNMFSASMLNGIGCYVYCG